MLKFLTGFLWVITGFGFVGLWRPFKTPNLLRDLNSAYRIRIRKDKSSEKYYRDDINTVWKYLSENCIKPYKEYKEYSSMQYYSSLDWPEKKQFKKRLMDTLVNERDMYTCFILKEGMDIYTLMADLNSELRTCKAILSDELPQLSNAEEAVIEYYDTVENNFEDPKHKNICTEKRTKAGLIFQDRSCDECGSTPLRVNLAYGRCNVCGGYDGDVDHEDPKIVAYKKWLNKEAVKLARKKIEEKEE